MDEYKPDGVYPEGSTYWGYGTAFSVVTNAMLESSFGTDFGLGNYPGFKDSAVFRLLMNAPSDWYYNYADCGDKRTDNPDVTLAWVASKSGDELLFERNRFMQSPEKIGRLRRLNGAGLVWVAQYEKQKESEVPASWKGEGANIEFFGALSLSSFLNSINLFKYLEAYSTALTPLCGNEL